MWTLRYSKVEDNTEQLIPTTDTNKLAASHQKGCNAPPPTMEYIIVLDFEWTANNKRTVGPVDKITHLSSVCMQLLDGKNVLKDFYSSYQNYKRVW